MKDAELNIAIDVTESGYVSYSTYIVDWDEGHHLNGAWKEFGYTTSFTVNALQILTFKEVEVPVVKVHCNKKPGVGWFKTFLWEGLNNKKIYDIAVETVGVKKATMLKLADGSVHYVNEPAEVFRNAISRFANA
jgi:hypothetical protein